MGVDSEQCFLSRQQEGRCLDEPKDAVLAQRNSASPSFPDLLVLDYTILARLQENVKKTPYSSIGALLKAIQSGRKVTKLEWVKMVCSKFRRGVSEVIDADGGCQRWRIIINVCTLQLYKMSIDYLRFLIVILYEGSLFFTELDSHPVYLREAYICLILSLFCLCSQYPALLLLHFPAS